ncbi:ABC transporter ATP-binding protein [Photobacterium iliopiscarium]|uniref:ABC transporter ATP-binding protein n=1 Tax=Photobacterium iliopiscarium TaxID=56192 RepID=A0A2T3MMY3_9GAMM|nr:ABC transporter ATP-binding protein [Photobacterium iliopiscarium]KJG13202.1 multidrug ABC transporter ATP-binding protein [Photobacterium iliopiscarium]PSU02214.1 ABC transporter ATP-binding protein [Photobacterium iliopiscarium]PSV83508.1 ABC transporter ATP-binding protein [Photobacterium iliopiscarium]PSV97919.1 ABC transporter ATP-binding protein [Photobacterium iliopiscarium]
MNCDEPFIKAQHITKSYHDKKALENISFSLSSGQVLGLLGHNGAGKSTLIKTLLGMHSCTGTLSIFNLTPEKSREKIVKHLAYISDAESLPEWMTVKQLMAYTMGVHPRFEQQKMQQYLAQTKININSKIKTLSKGMKVQLHLALVMSTNVNVLILDEPTLGLDLMYRSTFYRTLMAWFSEGDRALIIASHEVNEIAHLLTDVLVLKNGQVVLQASLSSLETEFTILSVNEENIVAAKQLKPLTVNCQLGQYRLLFEGVENAKLALLGDISQPSLADIFLAKQQEMA